MNDTNNPPEVVLELSRELAEFLEENCDRNIEFALKAMMAMPDAKQETLERLVELNEKFKELKKATKKALAE